VGEIEYGLAGMEAEVAGSRPRWLAHPRRGGGWQGPGRGGERALGDGIWPAPGVEVGGKSKRVGGGGVGRMGANGRLQPCDGWASYRAVMPHRVDRYMGALIIGGQHIPARAVGGQKGRSGLRRYRPARRQRSRGGVNPKAGDPWHRALPNVEHLPVRADRQGGWAP